jgi:hypothetical protein
MPAHWVKQTPALTRFDFGFWRISTAPRRASDVRNTAESGRGGSELTAASVKTL